MLILVQYNVTQVVKGELTAIPNTIISLCRSINIITNKYITKAEVSR